MSYGSSQPRPPHMYRMKVSPHFARDRLLNCFESANRDFSSFLKQPVTDEALKEQVKNLVQYVLSNCGVNFENPTKEGILLAINQCKAKE